MVEYRIIEARELGDLYARLKAEDILWALFPEDERSEAQFVSDLTHDAVLPLGGYVDRELGGMLIIRPFNQGSRCAEIGVTALRKFFPFAEELCRGALEWAFDNLDCSAMIGKVPVCNHHILPMLSRLGFQKVCRIPDLVYHCRKNKYVDGYLVMRSAKGA